MIGCPYSSQTHPPCPSDLGAPQWGGLRRAVLPATIIIPMRGFPCRLRYSPPVTIPSIAALTPSCDKCRSRRSSISLFPALLLRSQNGRFFAQRRQAGAEPLTAPRNRRGDVGHLNWSRRRRTPRCPPTMPLNSDWARYHSRGNCRAIQQSQLPSIRPNQIDPSSNSIRRVSIGRPHFQNRCCTNAKAHPRTSAARLGVDPVSGSDDAPDSFRAIERVEPYQRPNPYFLPPMIK